MAKKKPNKSKRSGTDVSQKRPVKKRSARKKGASKKGSSKQSKVDTRQRLQRVMASAGIASRRECEIIIEEGRVEVDGQVITKLGYKVDPYKQEIYVDAQKLVVQKLQYFMLNKPPGIVSTSKDPSGRLRVIDLIKTDKRVYNVGRLDKASEGLILVTNDGELANRLTHPRYGIEKKYHVQVAGVPAPKELKKLERGVYLAEGIARAARVKFIKRAKNGCWLEMVLNEGRNREIRRMLALIGHKVRTLKRVAIGPLRLGDLPVGAHRPLTVYELKALQKATSGEAKPKRRRKKKAAPSTFESESGGRGGKKSFKGRKSAGGKRTSGGKKSFGSAKSGRGSSKRGEASKSRGGAKAASRPGNRKKRS